MAKDVRLHLYTDQLFREHFWQCSNCLLHKNHVFVTKVVLYGCSSAFKWMNLEMQLLRDDFSVLTVEHLLLLLAL